MRPTLKFNLITLTNKTNNKQEVREPCLTPMDVMVSAVAMILYVT